MSDLEVKICGLSTAETVSAAVSAGADYVGFLFFAKSPRYIDPSKAQRLAELVPKTVQKVAVTVDPDDHLLAQIIEHLQPNIVQLHGTETPERVNEIKQRFGIVAMKALAIGDEDDLAAIERYRGGADRFLFDATPPKGAVLPGGNGLSFDWRLMRALDRDTDYMLSGGLNADNIAAAISLTGATAVDVSSGVETEPGIKDVSKIRQFLRAAGKPPVSADAAERV